MITLNVEHANLKCSIASKSTFNYYLYLSLNLIYFTTITKQVIQLILIMLVGIDVCAWMVFVWEETGVPGGNPPV